MHQKYQLLSTDLLSARARRGTAALNVARVFRERARDQATTPAAAKVLMEMWRLWLNKAKDTMDY